MVFATPSSNKPQQTRKISPCLQRCSQIQTCMPKWQLIGRTRSISRIDRNNIQISRGTNSLNCRYWINFLQVQAPEQDESHLRFLWWPKMNEPVQIYDYQRHVFDATGSPRYENYDLKRVANDNQGHFPIAAKAI